MDTASFLKMDIFFFVTTVVTVFVGALVVILLYYLVRIVRDISEITDVVKREAKDLAKDFGEVREDIKEGVHEVREKVEDGVATVHTYTKAVAGAGIVKAVSSLLEALGAERVAQAERKTRKRRTSKSEE